MRKLERPLVLIGCGKMGGAMLDGWLKSGIVAGGAYVVDPMGAQHMAGRPGVTIVKGADELPDDLNPQVVVLAVKPQQMDALAADYARFVGPGCFFLSVAAGIGIAHYEEVLGGETPVIRAMPNTPSLIREGMTVVSPGPGASEAHVAAAMRIFGAVGRVRELEEKHLDAVTGLSGSGPAFACVILEALADGGVRMGLPRDVAVELAAQTFQGAARMVLQTGRHPAALKDEVTTPAGCTIAGLLMMEDGKIRSTLARTIEEATRTAAGLGRDGPAAQGPT